MDSLARRSKHSKTAAQRIDSAVRSVSASSVAEGINVDAAEIRRVATERVQPKTRTKPSGL
jgi:hypothetical protein